MNDYPDVKSLLPHRAPFLFADKILDFNEQTKQIQTELFLSGKLPFFEGHFPEKPIMPGVLMLEAMAQTAGLYLSLASDTAAGAGKIFYLASSKVKFLDPVYPESTLILKASLSRVFGGLYDFATEAFSGDKLVAKASLVLASAERVK